MASLHGLILKLEVVWGKSGVIRGGPIGLVESPLRFVANLRKCVLSAYKPRLHHVRCAPYYNILKLTKW